MARNEEKKQSMLNRFLQGKVDEERGPRVKRPYLATECIDLNECDRWRRQILTEIGKKVGEIQNAGLGEHRIRDLNDEINKLIREKGHWERHIVELGGPDYSKISAAAAADGPELGGTTGRGGYKYFGAAKLLPGVRELFEKEEQKVVRRSRHQMHKSIDPDYYGFRDEDDGMLAKLEAPAEQILRTQAVLDWEEKEQERRKLINGGNSDLADAAAAGIEDGAEHFVAYVPLPDQRAIEARVLERKKADLLAKYTSEALQAGQDEAMELLNKRR